MIPFFKSEQLQREFESVGFVTLPVLGPDEIAALAERCPDVANGASRTYPGLFISLVDDDDFSSRRAVAEEINRVVGTALARQLHPVQTLLGAYLVKPGPAAHTAPHHDAGVIDHRRLSDACTATVWIPLRDVDETTGALGIIKSSHRFSERVIGTPPPAVRALTHGHEALLYRYLTFVPLKAGEAVIFDTRCVHGAAPNSAATPRMAVAVRIASQGEPLFQYLLKPGTTNRLLQLRITPDFLVKYRIQELYQSHKQASPLDYCEVVGEIADDFTPLSAAEMEALCRRYGATDNGYSMSAAGAGPPRQAVPAHAAVRSEA